MCKLKEALTYCICKRCMEMRCKNKTQYLKLYCNLFSRIGNLRHRFGPVFSTLPSLFGMPSNIMLLWHTPINIDLNSLLACTFCKPKSSFNRCVIQSSHDDDDAWFGFK